MKIKMIKPISILIIILFLFTACKQEMANVEIEVKKNVDHQELIATGNKITRNDITGIWTNGASENVNFEITPKTFHYVDDFKEYKYTLRNDSITINYPDYIYRAKVILENDTLNMISKDSKEIYWRFNE